MLRTSLVALALTACAPLTQVAAATPAQALATPPEACNKPVILVVWIEHLDRTRSRAYGEGLRSSQIVARNGGQYLAVSPPVLILEGEWPADRGFVTERYPCMAAFRAMWFSDEYQKRIKPLREGSGQYTIAVFDERPPSPQPAPANN